MPRKPPRSTEERLVRAQKSMMPGTLGGRVASAAPMALDVTRLDPRLRGTPRRPQKPHTYSRTGAISAAVAGGRRLYNDTDGDVNITSVRVSLVTPPSTTAVIVDVKMDGTTIYTTTANRPAVAVGGHTAVAVLPDVITWTVGSYLTIDVIQGDAAAADLTVQIFAA